MSKKVLYRSIMLEERVPDAHAIIGCFIDGMYYYRRLNRTRFSTSDKVLVRSGELSSPIYTLDWMLCLATHRKRKLLF